MFIVLLQTVNKDGEVLRLNKEVDEEKYEIHRGQYTGGQGRFTIKGTYQDLDNAIGVYCSLIPGFINA